MAPVAAGNDQPGTGPMGPELQQPMALAPRQGRLARLASGSALVAPRAPQRLKGQAKSCRHRTVVARTARSSLAEELQEAAPSELLDWGELEGSLALHDGVGAWLLHDVAALDWHTAQPPIRARDPHRARRAHSVIRADRTRTLRCPQSSRRTCSPTKRELWHQTSDLPQQGACHSGSTARSAARR